MAYLEVPKVIDRLASSPSRNTMNPIPEPDIAFWRRTDTYNERLVADFLAPLAEAASQFGNASADLQNTVLARLHWYFTVDRRERSPTVIVSEAMASELHEIVRRIMTHIDIETLEDFDSPEICAEVKQALLSYKAPYCQSPVSIDAFDRDQGLLRLSYYLHGESPSEIILIDGRQTAPAFAKYRACKYFRRMLFRQRIVWVPISDEKQIEIQLDGKPTSIALGNPVRLIADTVPATGQAEPLLTIAKSALSPSGRERWPPLLTLAGLRIRILHWVANLPPVRRRFANAWLFTDREHNANDNAEQMYRWVRSNHPEINTWFMLATTSPDWKRLADDGFKLVGPGWKRKLLLLNCDHLISSHAEQSRRVYERSFLGVAMKCRFSFLAHGISQNDVSHWLNSHEFDHMASTSADEYAAFVADNTPYIYTSREVSLSGFPRQDMIHDLAMKTNARDVRNLLIMPTWRASLARQATELPEHLVNTQYIQAWRTFLNADQLAALAREHQIEVVFMPHFNALPFLSAFSPPAFVKVVQSFSKEVLCRSIALVTDYTSVAFEMAGLRRTTFYYQFDREAFYGGDHNWRPGYFDYDRHGFGPVAFNQGTLLAHIEQFLERGSSTEPVYLARMRQAMLELDGRCCERVFDNIANLRKPYRSAHHSPKIT